jgi:hypothetical protein
MRIPSFLIALSFVVCAPANAHVGSADVFYENDAGPYHVFVTVRMPKVIPGLAQVEIRSESNDVREVRLNILRLSGFGYKLQAIPDLAQRSPQDPRFFVGSIWVMETYDLQVRIQIDGARVRRNSAYLYPHSLRARCICRNPSAPSCLAA